MNSLALETKSRAFGTIGVILAVLNAFLAVIAAAVGVAVLVRTRAGLSATRAPEEFGAGMAVAGAGVLMVATGGVLALLSVGCFLVHRAARRGRPPSVWRAAFLVLAAAPLLLGLAVLAVALR